MAINILLLLLIFLSPRKSVTVNPLFFAGESSISARQQFVWCLIAVLISWDLCRFSEQVNQFIYLSRHFLLWRETRKVWKSWDENLEKANAQRQQMIFSGGKKKKRRECPYSTCLQRLQRHLHVSRAQGGFSITRKKQCSKGNHQHVCLFLFSSCLPQNKRRHLELLLFADWVLFDSRWK